MANQKSLKLTLPPSVLVYKMEEIVAGNLMVDTKPTGSDKGVVYQVGKDVKGVKKGDKIVVPAWVPECFNYEGDKYYYFESERFPWMKYE